MSQALPVTEESTWQSEMSARQEDVRGAVRVADVDVGRQVIGDRFGVSPARLFCIPARQECVWRRCRWSVTPHPPQSPPRRHGATRRADILL